MEPKTIAFTIIALVIGFFIAKAIERMKTPTIIAAAEKRIEDYTHAEAVKLVGKLLDHLADTSGAQAKVAAGQAEMASQAQLLAAIQKRVASTAISAAS